MLGEIEGFGGGEGDGQMWWLTRSILPFASKRVFLPSIVLARGEGDSCIVRSGERLGLEFFFFLSVLFFVFFVF